MILLLLCLAVTTLIWFGSGLHRVQKSTWRKIAFGAWGLIGIATLLAVYGSGCVSLKKYQNLEQVKKAGDDYCKQMVYESYKQGQNQGKAWMRDYVFTAIAKSSATEIAQFWEDASKEKGRTLTDSDWEQLRMASVQRYMKVPLIKKGEKNAKAR